MTASAEAPIEVEEFLTWLVLERGRARSTVDAYRRDLQRWLEFLADRDTTLLDATEDDLVAFANEVRAAEAASTAKRRVVAARSLHRYLAEEQVVAVDIGADVAPPPVVDTVPKALEVDEVVGLLDSIGAGTPVDVRDHAMLEVLYGTGCRVAELVGMSLGDVYLEEGLVRVVGKGDKERIVPLVGTAHSALVDWLGAARRALEPEQWRRRGDQEAVWLNQRGGRLTRQGAWLVLKERAAAVGLAERWSPHVLRHSCATHLLAGGADIRIVQELLGHVSISTTQIYTRVTDDRLLDVWRRAHPRAG